MQPASATRATFSPSPILPSARTQPRVASVASAAGVTGLTAASASRGPGTPVPPTPASITPMARRNSAPSPEPQFPSPYKQVGRQHFTPLSQPRRPAAEPLASQQGRRGSAGLIAQAGASALAPSAAAFRLTPAEAQGLGLRAREVQQAIAQADRPAPPPLADLPTSPVLRLDALARLTDPADTLGFGDRASKKHMELVRGPVIRLYYQFTPHELKQRWASLSAATTWPGLEGASRIHFLRMRRLEMEVAAELLYTRDATACEADFETTQQVLEGQLTQEAHSFLAITLMRIRLHALARLLPPGVQHRLQEQALVLMVHESEPQLQARACRLLALRAGQMGEEAARRDLISPESLRRLRGERAPALMMQGRLIRLACEDATPAERQALRAFTLEMPLPAARGLGLPVPQALQLRRLMLESLAALSPPAPKADKVRALCDLSELAEKVPEGLARNQILLRGLALQTLVGAFLPEPAAAAGVSPDAAASRGGVGPGWAKGGGEGRGEGRTAGRPEGKGAGAASARK